MFVKKTITLGSRMVAVNKSALFAASARCFSSIELINRSG